MTLLALGSSLWTGTFNQIASRLYSQVSKSADLLQTWLTDTNVVELAKAAHITLDKGKDSICRGEDGRPKLEVHSVRPARRIGPSNQTVTELVIEMTQQRRGYFKTETQTKVDRTSWGLHLAPS